MATAAVTNREIGEALLISHSAVSRIRSGDRTPSWGTMQKIADFYEWSIPDQTMAHVLGAYNLEFEGVLVAYYGSVDADAAS